jgi:hypothetical protein
MGDPSAERQIANVYFTECDTVEGSFAVNGIGPRRFVCLTINFDDMHRILSIFSIKAVYLTNIDNEEVRLSRVRPLSSEHSPLVSNNPEYFCGFCYGSLPEACPHR